MWVGVLFIFFISLFISRSISKPIQILTESAEAVTQGNLEAQDRLSIISSRDEIGQLASSFSIMTASLKDQKQMLREKENAKNNLNDIFLLAQTCNTIEVFADQVIRTLALQTGSGHGLFYVLDDPDRSVKFKLKGSFAASKKDGPPDEIESGEGIAGQSISLKKSILFGPVPEGYIKINSALGQAEPFNILAQPVIHLGETTALLELASFSAYTPLQNEFIIQVANNLGTMIQNFQSSERTKILLEESIAQSEELQTQTLKIQRYNDELEDQTQKLKVQEEQLRCTNEELEEQTRRLAQEKQELGYRTRELEDAQALIEKRSMEVDQASRYKSEFLANMSHELRTPLNSIMVLSSIMAENRKNNMDKRQIKNLETIYSSGGDLLDLINDILDLSKVEAGQMELSPESIRTADLTDFLKSTFEPVVRERKLSFNVEVAAGFPDSFVSDYTRIGQILKNLLSNAIKFTDRGSVSLICFRPSREVDSRYFFDGTNSSIGFSVKDTGIGIPEEKQGKIFEAFKQVEANTTRKYGGTGLGLSICKELMQILGGKIFLDSEAGVGSTFTIILPERYEADSKNREIEEFKKRGGGVGLFTKPSDLEEYLTVGRDKIAEEHGIESFTKKKIKKLLIVEDDEDERQAMINHLNGPDIDIIEAGTIEDGLMLSKTSSPDCIILDIDLKYGGGFRFLKKINQEKVSPPVIVYTVKTLTDEENDFLNHYSKGIVIKSTKGLDRLLDETTLFLNRNKKDLPERRPEVLKDLHDSSRILQGKNILIVDDDTRNLFALQAILEESGAVLTTAVTGVEAIGKLSENPDTDLVLMDMMMPDMDGYEATRRIKQEKRFVGLPVIALTANAMKGEKGKCMDAGCDDYLSKPVEPRKLLSLLRIWLYRGRDG